jgi:hypothetical protein
MALFPRGIPGFPIPRYFSNGLWEGFFGASIFFFTVNLTQKQKARPGKGTGFLLINTL